MVGESFNLFPDQYYYDLRFATANLGTLRLACLLHNSFFDGRNYLDDACQIYGCIRRSDCGIASKSRR